MIAIDTNLLVYAHRTDMPEHSATIAVLEGLFAREEEWGIPSPCVAEFWSTVTHSQSSSRPSTPDEAAAFLRVLLGYADGRILLPRADFGDRLPRQAAELGVLGDRIFDLQIALVAVQNGADTIWTHDSRFVSVEGLCAVDPLRNASDGG